MTWEPYVSSGRVNQHAKVLATGEGLASYTRYYLTSPQFAAKHSEQLKLIIAELEKKSHWLKDHPEEAAQILGPLWGNLPQEVIQKANANRSYTVQPVIVDDLREQQRIADTFFEQKLLPNTIEAEKSDIFKY